MRVLRNALRRVRKAQLRDGGRRAEGGDQTAKGRACAGAWRQHVTVLTPTDAVILAVLVGAFTLAGWLLGRQIERTRVERLFADYGFRGQKSDPTIELRQAIGRGDWPEP